MPSLADILLDPSRRSAVLDDCETLIGSEVASKGGFGGIAVKGAFAIVKKVKPSIVRDVVDRLLSNLQKRPDRRAVRRVLAAESPRRGRSPAFHHR